MFSRRISFFLFLLIGAQILLTPPRARANVLLPALFSDNMVLQQGGSGANVWGTADPKENVTVNIGGKSASAVADDDGKWRVQLSGLRPGGPFQMTVAGKNQITIQNVAVGEVWLCAGASNMDWKVVSSANAEKEIADANHAMIRMFTVDQKVGNRPLSDCGGKWEVCDPQTVRLFSAVAYFFGRDLHQKILAPIGLIEASWPASPIRAWVPKSAFMGNEELSIALDDWRAHAKNHDAEKAAYDQQIAAWKTEADQARAEGRLLPRRPYDPHEILSPFSPIRIFNGMIAPLIPYSIKGAIWYQGEANTQTPTMYRKFFSALITGWRKEWGAGDFPFLFVQLPNYLPHRAEPGESSWAELREAQAAALALPKTGMAVTIDLGEERDMHPKNKQDVGHRLALIAEATVYGKTDVVYSGPVFSEMNRVKNNVSLSFKQLDGGLVNRNGPPLKGFAIAGEDRRFFWADAKIERNGKVTLHSDRVPNPVAVRYAWADSPDCDLANKAGLPAPPFRTDDWEPPRAPAANSSATPASALGAESAATGAQEASASAAASPQISAPAPSPSP